MYKMYSNKPIIQISPLTEVEYLRWSGLLAERLGIIVPKERKMFLQSKIWSRMREIGYTAYDKYWEYINSGIEGNLEWSQLVDRLTVHETSFFRHKPSFELVKEDMLRKIHLSDETLKYKMWSVSCATGEEAYSLAMLASNACQNTDIKTYFGVTATDVSSPAVALAKQAIYSAEKMANIDEEYRNNLVQLNDEMFTVKDSIKKRMAFGVFNLLDVNRPSNIKYDVIYCQNVLMYFEKKVREHILNGLVAYLNRDGLLVLGQTEINAWSHPKMNRVNKNRTLAFRLK
ncbi:CheR family methyltransferase [Marinicella litoralis]|uniref:protein-glutamate O-methyltransferase n=2 Tax=Marinicella litoralis TaxID=644220 RepID=A0A4R6XNJ1_9GAMM|nr:CheR family methyltransferase [Marinicella litoralis]TDR19524.1 chemotaxis protein methyltransferase CheR/type IV pilus assembly protein PilK [Marinicella litoralis]